VAPIGATRASIVEELDELKLRALLTREDWTLVCDAPFQELLSRWGIDERRLIPVDQLDRAVSSGRFAVVCTARAEGAVQRVLKEKNVQSFGLFNQLIPRLAARLSPRHRYQRDEPVRPVRLEYAILCLGRCGSTLLCRELRKAGAGYPVEHFRAPIQILMRDRNVSRFDFARWWDLVRSGVGANGIFATKVLYGFWEPTERLLNEEEKETVFGFLQGSKIIYLERADKCAQAVSDFMAQRTGVWHLWKTVSRADYDARVQAVEPDDDRLVANYNRLCANELALKAMMHALNLNPIKVAYDDLVADPKGTVARLVTALGLDLPANYLNGPIVLQSTTSDRHRVLRDRLEDLLKRRGQSAEASG